jgi:hypothetical protein
VPGGGRLQRAVRAPQADLPVQSGGGDPPAGTEAGGDDDVGVAGQGGHRLAVRSPQAGGPGDADGEHAAAVGGDADGERLALGPAGTAARRTDQASAVAADRRSGRGEGDP